MFRYSTSTAIVWSSKAHLHTGKQALLSFCISVMFCSDYVFLHNLSHLVRSTRLERAQFKHFQMITRWMKVVMKMRTLLNLFMEKRRDLKVAVMLIIRSITHKRYISFSSYCFYIIHCYRILHSDPWPEVVLYLGIRVFADGALGSVICSIKWWAHCGMWIGHAS